jgi:hypothetical protein
MRSWHRLSVARMPRIRPGKPAGAPSVRRGYRSSDTSSTSTGVSTLRAARYSVSVCTSRGRRRSPIRKNALPQRSESCPSNSKSADCSDPAAMHRAARSPARRHARQLVRRQLCDRTNPTVTTTNTRHAMQDATRLGQDRKGTKPASALRESLRRRRRNAGADALLKLLTCNTQRSRPTRKLALCFGKLGGTAQVTDNLAENVAKPPRWPALVRPRIGRCHAAAAGA